jgi:hypothetical protein
MLLPQERGLTYSRTQNPGQSQNQCNVPRTVAIHSVDEKEYAKLLSFSKLTEVKEQRS